LVEHRRFLPPAELLSTFQWEKVEATNTKTVGEEKVNTNGFLIMKRALLKNKHVLNGFYM
jgi:hypothetical protein